MTTKTISMPNRKFTSSQGQGNKKQNKKSACFEMAFGDSMVKVL